MQRDFTDIFSELNFILWLGLALGIWWFIILRIRKQDERAWLVLRNSIFLAFLSGLILIGEIIQFGKPRIAEILTFFASIALILSGFVVEKTALSHADLGLLILKEVSVALRGRRSWAVLGLLGAVMALGMILKP